MLQPSWTSILSEIWLAGCFVQTTVPCLGSESFGIWLSFTQCSRVNVALIFEGEDTAFFSHIRNTEWHSVTSRKTWIVQKIQVLQLYHGFWSLCLPYASILSPVDGSIMLFHVFVGQTGYIIYRYTNCNSMDLLLFHCSYQGMKDAIWRNLQGFKTKFFFDFIPLDIFIEMFSILPNFYSFVYGHIVIMQPDGMCIASWHT